MAYLGQPLSFPDFVAKTEEPTPTRQLIQNPDAPTTDPIQKIADQHERVEGYILHIAAGRYYPKDKLILGNINTFHALRKDEYDGLGTNGNHQKKSDYCDAKTATSNHHHPSIAWLSDKIHGNMVGLSSRLKTLKKPKPQNAFGIEDLYTKLHFSNEEKAVAEAIIHKERTQNAQAEQSAGMAAANGSFVSKLGAESGPQNYMHKL